MVHTNDLCSLEQTVSRTRDRYIAAAEEAERILEARRTDCSLQVQASELAVAELQSQLEFFEALEHERMASQLRRAIALAMERHQAVCRLAAANLLTAFRDYGDRLSRAIAAMSAELPGE